MKIARSELLGAYLELADGKALPRRIPLRGYVASPSPIVVRVRFDEFDPATMTLKLVVLGWTHGFGVVVNYPERSGDIRHEPDAVLLRLEVTA